MQEYSDEFWYERLLEKDSVSKQLNSAFKSSIIKKSMQEAATQKLRIERTLGRLRPEEYLNILGFEIVREEPNLMPSFLYMGLLVPDFNQVRLNETVIRLGEDWMAERFKSDEPVRKQFREIILFHELYHALEERIPGLYTKNVIIRSHVIGPFFRNCSIHSPSEIGAIHFSKLAAGVSFCPFLYTQYLLAATKQDTEVNDEF